ncbi:hypothetical protein RvY_00534 [Ramazzottius varieornatus]|uniref:Polypeptide N-acetylgalactosaminyltransferase n=1 Tax=Ramazzottius varieornatus TaxID=947166 RepID=A0A1D1UNI3_RAMVA|nr:hypothetical protein RvY_00534 [Ramazzottius varieornatus]
MGQSAIETRSRAQSSRSYLCIPRRISRSLAVIIFCSCVSTAAILGLRASSTHSDATTPSLARQAEDVQALEDWRKAVSAKGDSENGAEPFLNANYETRSDQVAEDAPGELGKPVPFSTFKISQEEALEMFKKEQFNLMASGIISLQRKLPDYRGDRCRLEKYAKNLPTASVIIVLYNEPLSSLLRTVWSVINRTRPRLLGEVILVDDASEREELRGKLEKYLLDHFEGKVKILRHLQHKGLIQAKLLGAKSATGDVLVFLDSHCEVAVGWLEPLLTRIKANRKVVACPLVDTLKAEDLSLVPSASWATGLFTWSLYYKWGFNGMTAAETQRVKDVSFEPHKTPTFPGGLFAIDRSWFFEVGSYDEEMQGWGGENLEMSFRVWMCGGEIEFVPCSRVAHVSRDHTYTFDHETQAINGARLAEVWLDDYRRLFYANKPSIRNASVGDLSARKRLREKLQCHTFRWYLENVYAEKFVPDENVLAYGQIRNPATNLCLHTDLVDEHGSSTFSCQSCISPQSTSSGSFSYARQLFSLSKDNELRREEWCIDVSTVPATPTDPLTIAEFLCKPTSPRRWELTQSQQLSNINSRKCLESFQHKVILAPCDASSASQRWQFVPASLSHSSIGTTPISTRTNT